MTGHEKAFWREWRRGREAELRSEGFTRHEARREAQDEARRRRTYVDKVGLEAAASAPVSVVSRGKGWTIRHFAFECALIPADKLEAQLQFIDEWEHGMTLH